MIIDKFEGWEVRHHVSYERIGFAIENPPAGSDPVPEEVGNFSVFVILYNINLKSELFFFYNDCVSLHCMSLL